MRKFMLACVLACGAFLIAPLAHAQEVPEKMPFDIPYGTPINLEQATKVGQAAQAEAKKRGWKLAIAVVVPSGELTYFIKMDGTQYGATTIAEHKARVAAKFRRPTKAFQDMLAANPPNFGVLLEDGVIASEGGVPIEVDGKIIGAIGCSGGAWPQDALVAEVGADALK